ncbi:sugar ABC transporter substrate-binding protein [Vallitalea guaymasensis]|uniref:sugar ABC transporter substrate-binding protein n=1 Tax=Vallitalea guaymasensis TaxID=1185412 RepID=UPI0023535700|nr:extracellular solute-binding protein [Vallitalea guaymasensis]
MRKLLSIIMILALTLSFAGCKKSVTAKFEDDLKWDDKSQSYAMEKDAKLMLWTDNDEFAEKVIELWDKKYPDVTLEYENVAANDSAKKIKLDGPAGLGADVFYMPHNSVVDTRESGTLYKLPERVKEIVMNDMQESAYKVAMYENDMYAIPSSIENIALVYNKQLLKALPVLPTTIKTSASNLLEQVENKEIYMEELLEGIASWGNNYSGAGIEVPYKKDRFYKGDGEEISESEDIHTILAWQLYDAYHNYPFLTRDGYRVFGSDNNNPDMFDIDKPEVRSSIEAVIGDWYGNKDESRLFPGLATLEDMGWDQAPSRFQKGQVAMTITGPWVMQDIKKNWDLWIQEGKFGLTPDSEPSDIFGATALPKFSNGNNPITFSGVQVTGMNIYTNYPNAAMNLISFLASDEVMKVVYSTLGKIPAVKDSSKIPGLNEDSISNGFLEQAIYSHAMPVIQEGNYMWDPLRDVWTNIFVEKMSIEEAQAKSLSDYQRILEDAGK